MKRTASILLDVTAAQAKALAALQAAYADACNALVPIVREHRVGASKIVMEDLTHIRERIKAGKLQSSKNACFSGKSAQTQV